MTARGKSKMRLSVSFLLALLVGCQGGNQQSILMLPDGKADLVAALKPELTHEEVVRFLEDTLIVGAFEEQHVHRPGLRGIVQSKVDGHVAFALILDDAAALAERVELRQGIESSPFLFRLFENVAPDNIDLDVQ